MVEQSGAQLVRGKGVIVGTRKVMVASEDGESVELQARHAVAICTGSEVIFPDVPGLKEAKPWTPREATSTSILPEHLIIIGAGAVGCEMATAYSSFGARVTVVTSTKEILPRFDAKAGKMVRESLTSRGAVFHLSTKVSSVNRTSGGHVQVILGNGEVVLGDELLVAAGRRPRTRDVGLDTLGLPTDGTPIAVDESLCVDSIPGRWLYAVGDVNGRATLTHMCKYQGRIAGDTIVARAKGLIGEGQKSAAWDKFSATADRYAVPQVVFTDPIVASVGFTISAAEKAGYSVREVSVPITTVGYLLHRDGQSGWAQWTVDATSNKLLGATLVGRDVEDLLHASTVAIVAGITLDQLAHAVPCFPTMTEVYLNLADAAEVSS
jgi:dihydrolipoamide dehydrogenase